MGFHTPRAPVPGPLKTITTGNSSHLKHDWIASNASQQVLPGEHMVPSTPQMGISAPRKGSARSGRGLMRATSRMQDPHRRLSPLPRGSGKKKPPVSASGQKAMKDMNFFQIKPDGFSEKNFKSGRQAHPVATSFCRHCREIPI